MWLLGGDLTGQGHHDSAKALGKVDFSVSCSPQAQAEFARAVALLHHMTYPQAREGFQKAASTDTNCAMAYWGIAVTLFQPLWPTRPRPDDLRRGWDAVQKAKDIQPPTKREQLFIGAAEAFFLEPSSTDYWLRIRRWEQAMETAFKTMPDDPEIAAFYALAHLAVSPSDRVSRENQDRSAKILLKVYEQNPNHPGSMHYLVHANDVPGRESELLQITRKYEKTAPRNPHALHMPTHIYTRLGDWDGVVRGNLLAAEAALEHPAGEKGEFVWDEFSHAIEYLVYADLQKGADDKAGEQLKRLHETRNLEPSFKTAFHLASTQARYVLERHDWAGAARIVPREPAVVAWNRFAWPEAISHFARGLGSARVGNIEEAKLAATRIEELEAATRKAGEELFARNIHLLGLELNAWIAQARSEGDTAAALLLEAVELESATPKHAVTPAPTIPAYELLGDLLAERRKHPEALAAYRKSLERYPKRFNSLLGAARSARAVGDASTAQNYYRELLSISRGGTRTSQMKEAEGYLRAK